MNKLNHIDIQGAREHNLQDISLKLPRNALIVITGLSGSGKSSLAFDTLYAEGQRRYVESLSAYARQFLEQLHKPDVDQIDGLSPAIAIEQKTTSSNPRSTVATQTEIYDYLRLLFARVGTPHCYECGKVIARQSAQEISQQIQKQLSDSSLLILAPVVRGRKGEFAELFKQIQAQGFVRVRVDGTIHLLEDTIKLDKKKNHTIEIVVDRLKITDQIKIRLNDSIETALKAGNGILHVASTDPKQKEEWLFSEHYACVDCGISMAELQPRLFSFNSPYGACPECHGLGTQMDVDPDLIIPEPEKSIREGAIAAWKRGGKGYIMYHRALIREFAEVEDIDLDMPFGKLPKAIQKKILFGAPNTEVWGKPFEGVIPNLERVFIETDSEFLKTEISKYMSVQPCPKCEGSRLKPESTAVLIQGKSILHMSQLTVADCAVFIDQLKLNEKQQLLGGQILKEIRSRLQFMLDVGLDYLSLDRVSGTLSGGEAQRIRLATQIGAGLVGVLYILDEPSIGLHPRDTHRLLATLRTLRDQGNTVVVVEHDEDTIQAADFIVDLGPGAGKHGGKLCAAGSLSKVLKSKKSLTAQYMRGERSIALPEQRRAGTGNYLEIKGAAEHNLKHVDAQIPLGTLTCVTGVSGSGKSTLVNEVLYRALAQKLYHSKAKPGKHKKLTGTEHIDKVIVIDQAPIGRTPRSNPATYTGVFSDIRDLFAKTPEAKALGYKPGRFSFNVKGGRCEPCQGEGGTRVEMHFLPPVYVTCDVCKGKRFNEATLEVTYKGKNISDVLQMSVEEALELFEAIPKIRHRLQTLVDVGLGYIEVGQPATTLSGGEAQRVKLATELSHKATGKTLYILDEPTTGLHLADVEKLLKVLHALVEQGNSILVIEHHPDVMKTADHLIDLGPEGGDQGGQIVATGTPEAVAQNKASHTGRFLKALLKTPRQSVKIKPKRRTQKATTV